MNFWNMEELGEFTHPKLLVTHQADCSEEDPNTFLHRTVQFRGISTDWFLSFTEKRTSLNFCCIVLRRTYYLCQVMSWWILSYLPSLWSLLQEKTWEMLFCGHLFVISFEISPRWSSYLKNVDLRAHDVQRIAFVQCQIRAEIEAA